MSHEVGVNLHWKAINQIDMEIRWGKPWRDKQIHIIKQFNQRFSQMDTKFRADENNIEYLVEVWLQDQKARANRIRREKIKSGKLQTHKTPAKNAKIPFKKMINPQVGKKCHVRWAYKGAKFVIREIFDDYVLVGPPKYNVDKRYKVMKEDLLCIRKKGEGLTK